jgi:hypothetical protein
LISSDISILPHENPRENARSSTVAKPQPIVLLLVFEYEEDDDEYEFDDEAKIVAG